jgi:CheY-like chemotaxis protein
LTRILSISYDATLLRTRELLLTGQGHEVTSALGFHRGAEACQAGGFDLFILGHSIPQEDKLDLIRCFREKNPGAPVIALAHPHELPLKEVDRYLDPSDPAELLRSLAFLINPAIERRRAVGHSTPIARVRKKSP